MQLSKQDFDLFTNRVKKILGIDKDKDLAAILELPASTYNRWKKAYRFPDTELRALSNKRPELKLDFDYIYTGITSEKYEQNIRDAGISATASAFLEPTELSEEEKHLVRLFRIMDGLGKDSLLNCAEGMAYKREYSPLRSVLDQ